MWYLNTEEETLINLDKLESIEIRPRYEEGGGYNITGFFGNGNRNVLYSISPENDDEWDEIEKGLSYKDKANIFLNALQVLFFSGKTFSNNLSLFNEETILNFIKESKL